MNEPEIILKMPFIAHGDTPEVLQPGEQSFYFPPAPIASQDTPVLGRRSTSVTPMRGDHLNVKHGGEAFIEWVTIVGRVADKSWRHCARKPSCKRRFNELDFVRGSACHVDGERKTDSVRHGHEFAALAAFGGAHTRPPFFAGANIASTNVSDKSNWPRSTRSSASAWRIRNSVPDRHHC